LCGWATSLCGSGYRPAVPSDRPPSAAGEPRRRRADAERNRLRLLVAARALVAEHGLAATTMDALAEVAGVGKGTVYRAFGSRAGLAQALVDEAEHGLQDGVLRGPPPLGPGADPAARVAAFARAYLVLLVDHGELIVELDHGSPAQRFATGSHSSWSAHLAGLSRTAGHRHPVLVAEQILALLSAELHRHLDEDTSLGRITVRNGTVAAIAAVFAGADTRPARARQR
jgi:AcrR family transcriptional regulator